MSFSILAVSKLLLAFGAMHGWPDNGTCQPRVGRNLKRCVHESEVVRIILNKNHGYPSLVRASADGVPGSNEVVVHWSAATSILFAVYLMLSKIHSLRGREYVYMHHGCRERRQSPGPRVFVSEGPGNFWRVPSLSLSDQAVCTADPFLHRLSSPFPLTTSTTLHLHYGQRNVCLPPPLLTQHSSSPCRKYYDLLETQPDASESDLKKAYRKK